MTYSQLQSNSEAFEASNSPDPYYNEDEKTFFSIDTLKGGVQKVGDVLSSVGESVVGLSGHKFENKGANVVVGAVSSLAASWLSIKGISAIGSYIGDKINENGEKELSKPQDVKDKEESKLGRNILIALGIGGVLLLSSFDWKSLLATSVVGEDAVNAFKEGQKKLAELGTKIEEIEKKIETATGDTKTNLEEQLIPLKADALKLSTDLSTQATSLHASVTQSFEAAKKELEELQKETSKDPAKITEVQAKIATLEKSSTEIGSYLSEIMKIVVGLGGATSAAVVPAVAVDSTSSPATSATGANTLTVQNPEILKEINKFEKEFLGTWEINNPFTKVLYQDNPSFRKDGKWDTEKRTEITAKIKATINNVGDVNITPDKITYTIGKSKVELNPVITKEGEEYKYGTEKVDDKEKSFYLERVEKKKSKIVEKVDTLVEGSWYSDILNFFQENGVMDFASVNALTTSEAFTSFIKDNANKENVNNLLEGINVSSSVKLALSGVFLLFLYLAKNNLKRFVGIGLTGGVLAYGIERGVAGVKNDANSLLNSFHDIVDWVSEKITGSYSASNNSKKEEFESPMLLSIGSIFNIPESLLSHQSDLSPEFFAYNKLQIDFFIAELQKKEKNTQDSFEKETINTAIESFKELSYYCLNKKNKIPTEQLMTIFASLQILEPPLNISVKKTLQYKNEVRFDIEGKEINFAYLPFNPYQDILTAEEKTEKYKDKKIEVFNLLSKRLNAFNTGYMANNPSISNTEIDAVLLFMKKNEDSQTIPNSKELLNTIKTLIKIKGVKVEKIEGVWYLKTPDGEITPICFDDAFDFNGNNPQDITFVGQEEVLEKCLGDKMKYLKDGEKSTLKNLKYLHQNLPNGKLKNHLSIYLNDGDSEFLSLDILKDTAWWVLFFGLLINDPSMSSYAKIENGIFKVAGTWGRVAIFSILEPYSVIADALSNGLGESIGKYVQASATSAIILGTATSLTNFSFKKGLFLYAKIDPVLLTLRQSVDFYRASQHSKLGVKELWAIRKKNISSLHFMPNKVQLYRSYLTNGDSSILYFFEKYAMLQKELNILGQGKFGFVKREDITIAKESIVKIASGIMGGDENIDEAFKKATDEYNKKVNITSTPKEKSKFLYEALQSQESLKVLGLKEEMNYVLKHDAGNISTRLPRIGDKLRVVINNLAADDPLATSAKLQINTLYSFEVNEIIKNYTHVQKEEVIKKLERIKSNISGSMVGEKINKVTKDANAKIKIIDNHIKTINAGKIPQQHITFLRKVGNFAGKWGARGLFAFDAIGNVGNIFTATGNSLVETDENQKGTYSAEALANAGIIGLKFFAYKPTPAAAVLVPLSIIVDSVVSGGFDAQHRAEYTESDFKDNWTKEKLLNEVSFMEADKMDTNVKELFSKSGATTDDIKNTMWAALAMISAEENNISINQNEEYKRYFELFQNAVSLQFSKTKGGVFEVRKVYANSKAFADAKIEDFKISKANGIIHSAYTPETTINFEQFKKQENNNEKISLTGMDLQVYKIAKNLYSYDGDPTEKSLHEFFEDPQKGLYYDSGKKQWKIHCMQDLVSDEVLSEATAPQNMRRLITFVNENPDSIFHSSQHGTAEMTYNALFDSNDENRKNVFDSAKQLSFSAFQVFLEPYKSTLRQFAKTKEEMAILIFSLYKTGKTTDFNVLINAYRNNTEYSLTKKSGVFHFINNIGSPGIELSNMIRINKENIETPYLTSALNTVNNAGGKHDGTISSFEKIPNAVGDVLTFQQSLKLANDILAGK